MSKSYRKVPTYTDAHPFRGFIYKRYWKKVRRQLIKHFCDEECIPDLNHNANIMWPLGGKIFGGHNANFLICREFKIPSCKQLFSRRMNYKISKHLDKNMIDYIRSRKFK